MRVFEEGDESQNVLLCKPLFKIDYVLYATQNYRGIYTKDAEDFPRFNMEVKIWELQ